VIEVIAFTGTPTHTSEHGQAPSALAMLLMFHHAHGLATPAAEQANLAAFGKRAHQVNHL
jgi:hypothetical protein